MIRSMYDVTGLVVSINSIKSMAKVDELINIGESAFPSAFKANESVRVLEWHFSHA